METNNLTLEQQLILSLTKETIQKNGIDSLEPNTIGKIRCLANKLAEDIEPAGSEPDNPNYPSFWNYMSEKTIRILHNSKGIETPEQLAEYDFEKKHLFGFIPNIELLQYAMEAGIKLKNYRF